ncbi:MAG: multiheme c-type cytochrome [Acidobacteria bacterium]|nr:multiheme c-type cytochrome [Acidobacteriota bacterium]
MFAAVFFWQLWVVQLAGNSACAPCHANEVARHARSGHGRALRPAAPDDHLQGLTHAEANGTRYRYPAGNRVEIAKGGESLQAVFDWAFGSGLYGITYVGQREGRWVEHRLTYYLDSKTADFTPGHRRTPPATLIDALGVRQSVADARRCFGCHATGVQPGDEATGPDLKQMVPGVQCERCHGPGAAHVKAPTAKNVLNPGRFPARQQVLICGECHRTPPAQNASREPELDDPLSVRFQPVGLMASNCFQKSGKLSCLTCHDAHDAPQRKNAAFYDAKCVGCHEGAGSKLRRAAQCKPDCVSCHMPKSTPVPHLTFTDHRIRAY